MPAKGSRLIEFIGLLGFVGLIELLGFIGLIELLELTEDCVQRTVD